MNVKPAEFVQIDWDVPIVIRHRQSYVPMYHARLRLKNSR